MRTLAAPAEIYRVKTAKGSCADGIFVKVAVTCQTTRAPCPDEQVAGAVASVRSATCFARLFLTLGVETVTLYKRDRFNVLFI